MLFMAANLTALPAGNEVTLDVSPHSPRNRWSNPALGLCEHDASGATS